MVHFSFLEYTYNPLVDDEETIFSSLNKLGFVQRNIHSSLLYSMWTQNQCIIGLRKNLSIDKSKITGIGLTSNDFIADNLAIRFDPECSMNVIEGCNGLRIILLDEENIANMIDFNYSVVDKKHYDTTGLEYFSGIVYNSAEQNVLDFFQSIGFKLTKQSEMYYTLVSGNNRFSIMLNKLKNNNEINNIVADTHDVFKTTSCMAVTGVKLKEFILDKLSDFGKDLNYKIIGYNCAAIGNKESFTIENCVDAALPSLNLIFRMRKQYLNINEQLLELYHANNTETV